jgi:ATP-dependent exoDNAse (exonuclease V) beta subunit
VHRGKLALLLADKQHEAFRPVADYLTEMATACPHDLFQEEHRASAMANAFDLTGVAITERQNLAPRIAHLALQAVTHNKRRHDELQRFMLMTDSVTVAVEVPVYLTPKDLRHLTEDLGFQIPLSTTTPLTGHIDVLQIRHGRVHILDYKPGAVHERPIAQLMVYALALSRRTGLRLYDFVCAWFDDQHYYEFYPLHVVHKRRR